MEINDDHIIELIKGQSATSQALKDLQDTVSKGFTFIHTEHKDLDKRVSNVEKKAWWMSGAGSTVGFLIGWGISFFKH